MSHFTTLKLKIKDLQALKKACDELNLSFIAGQKARGWNGNNKTCDYVISWEGTPYDIAVIKEKNGEYSLQADFWGGHIAQKLGVGLSPMGKLLQAYGKYAIMHTYSEFYLNSSTRDEEGNLVLQLESY